MCGIYGIWQRDGSAVDLRAVQQAVTQIRHRGPDDEGYLLVNTQHGGIIHCGGDDTMAALGLPHIAEFFGQHFDLVLGFRRLAILDLSSAGHQPMCLGDKWMVFNGEVYNYRDLRSTLPEMTFKSGTDTEVILAKLLHSDVEAIPQFNGMWAFAVWDMRTQTLVLSRDRFGIKPLYYARQDKQIRFASEIKALVGGHGIPFCPNDTAVCRMLVHGRLPDPTTAETFFEGVENLPAAHWMRITADEIETRCYWAFAEGTPELSSEVATANLRELFTDSVRLRLQADVAVGTSLSGGLDSSSIATTINQLMQHEQGVDITQIGEHQKTFSAVYDVEGIFNEKRFVDLMVAHTKADASYTIPSVERLIADADRMAWHQDEPFTTTSIFAQWCVMSLVREKGITVLLDGQGADELLAGYQPFGYYLRDLIARKQLLYGWREAQAIKSVTGIDATTLYFKTLYGLLGQQPVVRPVAAALYKPLQTLFRQIKGKGSVIVYDPALRADFAATQAAIPLPPLSFEPTLDSQLRWAVSSSLPNLLRYEDRNSMAFSIEARVPFLDYRLAEYIVHKARDWRIRNGWTKWVFRQAMTDALPREVAWRQDKVGYETPETLWSDKLSQYMRESFTSGSGISRYLDVNRAQEILAQPTRNRDDARQRWRWMSVARWLHVFGE